MTAIQRLESQVRSYCRSFPAVFETAAGACLFAADGRRYIDFFAGAGTLNYGHNHPVMTQALIDYLSRGGIVHGLDMATTAKERFLERFEEVVLAPRDLQYRVQFTGPTGTNAVEAALKLARLVKRRSNVVAFTQGYHGLTSGALAVTARRFYRNEAYVNRSDVSFLPYDGYFGPDVDTLACIEKLLTDEASGVDLPAAVIVETIQAEGGVNVATAPWLKGLAGLCRALDILLIVDDIQVGCGRSGTFLSCERAGVEPDMVVLSKSISGFGLPMSLVLIRPKIDQWKPGEHSGTFRGNNLAFVTATEALALWETKSFARTLASNSQTLAEGVRAIAERFPELGAKVRGLGMIYGLEIPDAALAWSISRECFQRGLIIELCGPRSNVLKFLPPLVIDEAVLQEGLEIIAQAIESLMARTPVTAPSQPAVVHRSK